MPAFTDLKNRTWSTRVAVGDVRRVKQLLGVDLLDVVDEKDGLWAKFMLDPVFFVDVLCALLRPQLQTANVSDEEFAEALAGDTLGAAVDATLQGVVDFFPEPRRTALRKALTKAREVEAAVMAMAERKLEAIQPERLANSLGSSSGNAPGSAASTPTD